MAKEKEFLRLGTKILFCGHGLNFFARKRYQLSPVIFFWLNTLKRTAKTPSVDLLKLNALEGIQTAF